MIPRIPTTIVTGAAASIGGAIVMMGWRIRETQRPVTVPLIVIPPLGMSTGFMMFLFPPSRIPVLWGVAAFALGALVLAVPLARTSRLERRGDVVMLQRSRAFLWILLGLVLARFLLRDYIGHIISPMQTASVLFVVAFGMILRWRLGMYAEYQRLVFGSGKDSASR